MAFIMWYHPTSFLAARVFFLSCFHRYNDCSRDMETEKLILNRRDKECLKIAMLKQDETFKLQVYELHRLYRVQKRLTRDAARTNGPNYARVCSHSGRPDLELTLGPRSYYLEKMKAAELAFESDSGPSLSSSSTHTRGSTRSAAFDRDDLSGQQKLCGPEMPARNGVNQDRLNGSPWLFRALSLNIT